jgi:DNA polymerase-3 subunit delta
MLYVFHGEDELSRSEAIAQLRRKTDPVVGELNTASFDGREVSVGTLQAACDTMPFMAGCRLVIVSDFVSPSAGGKDSRRGRREAPVDGGLRGLEEYLPRLPESTQLVLNESRSLPDGHPLLRLASDLGACVRQFALPQGPDLEQWIARRARDKGTSITWEAMALLANYVGPNLRLLDQELEKLATYLGEGGTIGRQEVERLVSSLQEASIFHMVDALASRDRRRALTLLRRLLSEGAAPLYLLTMIARQFRLLLQAQELEAQRVPAAAMAQEMAVPAFVVRKSLQQARNFRPAELRTILAHLLDIDVGIKTGQVDGPLALDLFVVRWAGRRGG